MKKILIILIIFLTCSACKKQETVSEIKKTSNYLTVLYDSSGDMVLPLNTDVYLITVEPNKNEAMLNDFKELIHEYHKLLDSHHDYLDINNLKTINDNYGNGPVKVDEKLIETIKSSIEISISTGGLFNPTAGALSDVWKDKFNNEHINTNPDSSEIEKAKACVLSPDQFNEYIVIDEINNTVEIKKLPSCSTSVKFDLGAYSKGYVLDKAYDLLLKYNSGFMLNAGGSSLIAYTPESQMDKVNWTISLSDPNNPTDAISYLRFKNIFMSTSGDYQQYFFDENGIRRHHILNPYTGYPENNFRSISLFSSSKAGMLDAISTSLYSTDDYKSLVTKVSNDFSFDFNTYVIYEVDGKLIQEYDETVKEMFIQ